MPRVNFANVQDNTEFEILPLGKYPCVLAVSNEQKDSSGQVMKDAENNPAIRHTNAGDERWDIKATILDGKHTGRWITDNLSFGEKALKRVKIVFVRAGIIEGDEAHDCTPDELDGTYWWVEIDRQEARTNKDGTPKLRKDGKPILDPRVGFAGYEPMSPQEAKRYRESYAAWLAKKNGQSAENGAESGAEAGDSDVPF
jgi:hypothetical protein